LAVLLFDGASGILRLRLEVAGGGSFTDGQTLPVFQLGFSVVVLPVGLLPPPVVGDLDGDGRPDLAWPSFAASGVATFRNHGDGSLEPMRMIPVGGTVRGVAIGDVTGDGAPDLVVPESGSPDDVAVVPGLARPVVDTNADGVPDCRQELAC